MKFFIIILIAVWRRSIPLLTGWKTLASWITWRWERRLGGFAPAVFTCGRCWSECWDSNSVKGIGEGWDSWITRRSWNWNFYIAPPPGCDAPIKDWLSLWTSALLPQPLFRCFRCIYVAWIKEDVLITCCGLSEVLACEPMPSHWIPHNALWKG